MEYEFRDSVPYDLFRITSTQGIIYVWNSSALNADLVPSITLSIRILDNYTYRAYTDSVDVRIVNDPTSAVQNSICGM